MRLSTFLFMTTILSSLNSSILTLTLNRPSRANSFNFEMTNELRGALENAEKDSQVRCVVITGADKVFSAGQDITEMKRGAEISYREHLERTYNPLILQIRNIGKPIVAAVNGPCAGAAFGVALACDLRIAHTRAYFVVGFSGIALAPDSGVSLLLPTYIGLGRAQEYFYSNEKISARTARQWGLVNRVGGFNFEALVKSAAQNLSAGPREAFAFGKRAFNQAVLPNLAEALDFEGVIQEKAGKTAEHKEGVAAFLGKRRPKFE
ncbi:MAG: enoyl-CoA hydratase-related protein [Anaerolineales bacterium]|nr:enoyl-CoA hydratase-related protein [Anaerolineales bacterium]